MKTIVGSSLRTKPRELRPRHWQRRILVALFFAVACSAAPASLQLVSVLDPSQGPPAGGSGDSYAPVISPDGRYVLFASAANNLLLATNNHPIPLLDLPKLNVFLRDRTNATTTLVSVNLSGVAGGNADSWPAAISTNGRYVLFESSASDLVPGDTNNAADIFVRDLLNGATTLVSVSTNGGIASSESRSSVMTPDGRYVAFVSAGGNLVTADTNGIPDVFVRDLQSQVTVLASVGAMSTNRTSPIGSSECPDLTPDGRYVVFWSTATNLVPGVTTVGNLYVRDLVEGTTTWASSYARTALQALNRQTNAVCYNHALSTNGQFVAYEVSPALGLSGASVGLVLRYNMGSGLTDLVHTNAAAPLGAYEDIRSLDMTPDGRFVAFVANTNVAAGTATCVCVWDAQTGRAALASGNLSNAVAAGSTCDWPALDDSGRYVAFLSSSTNVVTNRVVGDSHLYLRDMQAASTALVDTDTNGVGSGLSPVAAPRLSADGRFVAFECLDASLVPNDRNHDYDVFVRDAVAQVTELVSAHDAALPSLTPNGGSLLSPYSASTGARYVAFASDADNLVPNDTNGCWDVFVRDLLNGTNLLVSVSSNGIRAAAGPSTDPGITADGGYVVFSSWANDLVAGDNNSAQDVFVRDVRGGTTTLVSIKTGGGGPANADAYSPVISDSGRYVLFRSKASNLAAGTLTGTENLFLRDRQTGTNYALTTAGAGAAVMTRDGRHVAFGGASANVYVWDSQAAAKVYTISPTLGASAIGISPDGNRIAYAVSGQLYGVDRAANTNWLIGSFAVFSHSGPRFSGDGRFLTYAGPVNTGTLVYLYDFQTGSNLVVSQADNAGPATYGVSDSPDISSDGRFVAYRSSATNVVPGDSNGLPDVFVYDGLNHMTTLLSVSRFGPTTADNRSLAPVFSPDGQMLVFESWASDLVAQDFNQGSDVFAYNLFASGEIPLFSAAVVHGNRAGQGPWITWPAVSGKTYHVQFKNSLSDLGWQEFSGGVVILGNQGYLNDLSVGAGPRFYRVVAY
jgi:Tol biopolymer transport system component